MKEWGEDGWRWMKMDEDATRCGPIDRNNCAVVEKQTVEHTQAPGSSSPLLQISTTTFIIDPTSTI